MSIAAYSNDFILSDFVLQNKTNNLAKNYDSDLDLESKTTTQFVISFLQQETSLIWIIFGTIGNLLSLFVLLRRKMRIHSTFTYLTILAVCDTLVLYFGLLRDFLVNKYNYDINGDILCKFHVFSFYFVLHMASWLLVAVNIDRLIAASFLSLSKRWCTPRTAIKVSVYLAIFLMIINSHFLYYVDSGTETNKSSKIVEHYSEYKDLNFLMPRNFSIRSLENFEKNSSLIQNIKLRFKSYFLFPNQNDYYFGDFDESKNDLDPSNPTYTKNEFISEPVNPYVYKKCFIKANSPAYSYFFQKIFTWIDASAQVILPFIIMVVCNINIIHKVLLTKNKTNGKNLKRLRKIKGMCIMIVSVSVIFFILEAPILIFICLIQGSYIKQNWPYIELFWTIMNLMMYTNHVINFISYCMTGTKFRRELLRLLFIHNIAKYLTIYKDMLISKNDQNVIKQNGIGKFSKKIQNEEQNTVVKFFSRNQKLNFITEPIIKNKTKPVNLTTGILNKKKLLGESAVTRCNYDSNHIKDSESDVSDFRNNKYILVDSGYNTVKNVIVHETDNQIINRDNCIGTNKSFTRVNFKSFKKFNKKSKKEKSLLVNSEKVNIDDFDIELDEETENY